MLKKFRGLPLIVKRDFLPSITKITLLGSKITNKRPSYLYCNLKICRKRSGFSWFVCFSPYIARLSSSRSLLVPHRTMVGSRLWKPDHCYQKLHSSSYLCYCLLLDLTRLVGCFAALLPSVPVSQSSLLGLCSVFSIPPSPPWFGSKVEQDFAPSPL